MRAGADFMVGLGAWRLRVRVLPDAAAIARLWRGITAEPVKRGDFVLALFDGSDRAPLGMVALSAADLTAELVAHEATHAAAHALRLKRGALPLAQGSEAEEYLATAVGQLTRRILRGLAARGIEVRA
jgi:hypothetical protein